MTRGRPIAELDAILGKLDEVTDELRRLQTRTEHVLGRPGQGSFWDDGDKILDAKTFALDLLERARWCPEPTWPRMRRKLVDELETRLWALLEALTRPELADIEDLEALLLEVETQTHRLLSKRGIRG